MTKTLFETQTCRALDYVFRVSTTDIELRAVLNEVLVDMVIATGSVPERHVHLVQVLTSAQPGHVRVMIDSAEEFATLHTGAVLSHLLIEINQRAVVATPHYLALHAGTARQPALAGGQAVLFAGQSHSGKTTLITQLTLDGWGFIADEVSAIDMTRRRVLPYGKPVALRPRSATLLKPKIERLRRNASPFELDERFVPPRDLGDVACSPTALGAVVFPTFDPMITPFIRQLAPADALTALIHSALHPRGITRDMFMFLASLVREVPCLSVTYQHFEQVGPFLCSSDYTQ